MQVGCYKFNFLGGWGIYIYIYSSVNECLPSTQEALSLIPSVR